jgi:uncharacterized protein YegP (UPF0339 family)
MNFRLQLRKHKGRHPWRLHLVAENGEEIASSEGYFSKWNAKRAARKMFPLTPLEDKTK